MRCLCVHFLPILTSLELDEVGGEVNFVGLAAATSETSSRDGVSGCVAVLRIFNFVPILTSKDASSG